MGRIDQGLDFDQERAGALLGDHDAGAGHFLTMLGRKAPRVVDPLEAAVGHGEDAQFVDRAKSDS